MGYTPEESHVQADELGDTFTDDMIERIAERLGYPDRCPHGWPVDTAAEQLENRELNPLSDLVPGDRATIVRLAEHDGDLLHWFYANGLVPDAEVEIERAADGDVVAVLASGEVEIGERAAAGLFVRRR
jgi:DtxR family Mn-dependent transcriptional regulator